MSKYCCYLVQKLDRTIYCRFFKKKICISECNGCKNKCYETKRTTKRTKELAIPKKVKLAVWERDNHKCIFCHKEVEWNYANSHFIKRSQGGLGIEENILTNCRECHRLFDDSIERQEWRMEYAEKYLRSKYPNWNKNKLVYKKGGVGYDTNYISEEERRISK